MFRTILVQLQPSHASLFIQKTSVKCKEGIQKEAIATYRKDRFKVALSSNKALGQEGEIGAAHLDKVAECYDA